MPGPEGPLEPVGSRSCPRELRGLGSRSGSLGRGPLPWEAPSSGRPSGSGGRRRGLGRPGTCLTAGGGELGRGQPRQAGRSAPLGAARPGSCAARPEKPGNGGPGAGARPTGATSAVGRAGRPGPRWEEPGPAPPPTRAPAQSRAAEGEEPGPAPPTRFRLRPGFEGCG